MTGREFVRWAREQGISEEEIALKIGMKAPTIYGWGTSDKPLAKRTLLALQAVGLLKQPNSATKKAVGSD